MNKSKATKGNTCSSHSMSSSEPVVLGCQLKVRGDINVNIILSASIHAKPSFNFESWIQILILNVNEYEVMQ